MASTFLIDGLNSPLLLTQGFSFTPAGLVGWLYRRAITDGTGGSLANVVCEIALTSANFDFSLANTDGSDLRVYDETATAVLPIWLMDYDSVAQTATLFYRATLTSHTHNLYYGNAVAPAVSSFPAVFDHGTGFDTGWGDLSTAVAGAGGAATRYAGPTSTSDSRNYLFWRLQESPTLSLSDLTTAGIPAGNYTGIREFNLIRDTSNRVLQIGGLYYATFSRRPNNSTDPIDAWIAHSASKSGPWAGFAQMWTPAAVHVDCVGCTIKVGSTYYCFTTYGWTQGGGTSPGLVVKLRTSTDLTTWTDRGTILSPGVFNDITSGVCTDIGNPWVCPLADGTYVMTVEGYNGTNAQWSCYGATSSGAPFTSWSVLNSGNALVSKGAGGTWDGNGAANPKFFQMPDHSFVIEYNGSDDAVNLDWELGFASASSAGGPYTKNVANPVGGHTTGTYGCETAHLSWDENGTDYYHACQRFDTASNTAHAFLLYQEKRQGGLLVSRDPVTNTDGAVAGVVLSAGTFTAETQSVILAHRSRSGAPILAGIWDEAAIPTPAANAGLLAVRGVEIRRGTHDLASAGDVFLTYFDSGSTQHFWSGSAWSTTATSIAGDYAREVIAKISDDGTNYILTVSYADDGTVISGPASIAQSSVRSMTNRLLITGDPFTDAWCQALWARRIDTRPYVATEPTISLGARQNVSGAPSSAALSGPSTGKLGVISTNFTITLDLPASSALSFPITYAGGSVTTSPVLFGIGDSSKTFTVTPSLGGTSNVSLGVGSTGLTVTGSPVAYTATAATATLTGPVLGPIGSASDAFTVLLDGPAPSGGISCPTASSVGTDTVMTSPVVIAAGQTLGTFTVTAIDAGTRNITLSATTPSLTLAGTPIVYLASATPVDLAVYPDPFAARFLP